MMQVVMTCSLKKAQFITMQSWENCFAIKQLVIRWGNCGIKAGVPIFNMINISGDG